LEVICDAYNLDCGHAFCRGCVNAYQRHGVNDVCPYCRAPLPPSVSVSVKKCREMNVRIVQHIKDGNMLMVKVTHTLMRNHANRAVQTDPNSAKARVYLGVCLYGIVCKDADNAEREFHEAIRCDPNDARAHYGLGHIMHSVRKDYDGAEREYRESTRCSPNQAFYHLGLGGLLHDTRKDYDGAELEWREALRCDPNCEVARLCLAWILLYVRKDYDGAEREYREALRCTPNLQNRLRLGVAMSQTPRMAKLPFIIMGFMAALYGGGWSIMQRMVGFG
jgi:Tfp pilus assembly protein PilF